MRPSIYSRISYPIFALFFGAVPLIVFGAMQAVESNSNRIEDWLPESFEESQNLQWFKDQFISDDILLISWEGCTLDDPRIARLAELLEQPAILESGEEVLFFRQIITSPGMMELLTSEPLNLTEAEASQKLRGWLVGMDGKTGCLVTLATASGWEHRHLMVKYIYACAETIEPEWTVEHFHVAGSTMDAIAIDQASTHRLVQMMLISFLICFVLMLVLFRSFLLSLMVFFDALFCQQLTLALIYYSGTRMDSVLLMVPTLVFVLAVSAGVHLGNYYFDAVKERGVKNAPQLALKYAFAPVVLASITTAIGIVSLRISSLAPLRNFGTYGALSVLASTAVLLILLPCQLSQFPPRCRTENKTATSSRWRTTLPAYWISLLIKHPTPIVLLALVALLGSMVGVSRLKTTARIHDMFRPDAQIIRDYDWVQREIAPLVPLEIVLKIPKSKDDDATIVDRLHLISEIERELNSVEGVGVVVSPLAVSPTLPVWRGGGLRQWSAYFSRSRELAFELEKNRDKFVELGFLRESEEEELWRISVRSYAGRSDVNNSILMEEMEKAIEPILAAHNSLSPGMTAVFCGSIPLVQKSQEQMLSDLILSFIVAFGLIAVMMTALMLFDSVGGFFLLGMAERGKALLRCIVAGLLTMIPNVLPCVLIFGAMGLMAIDLDVGTVMTATVALGVAVDDTLHFLSWFRRGFVISRSRPEAVKHAYHYCAAAMIQTSLICGLGLLVFVTSPFVPMNRFSWLMFCMLITAILGDLIVLPAILVSRLGVFFEPLILSNSKKSLTLPQNKPS